MGKNLNFKTDKIESLKGFGKIPYILINKSREYREKKIGRKFSFLINFLVSVLLVFIAVLFKFSLFPFVPPPDTPFVVFFIPIMLSSWLGGFWPGVFTTFLSTFAVDYFLVTPGSIFINDFHHNILFFIFTVQGIGIAWLNNELLSSVKKTKNLSDDLQKERDVLKESNNKYFSLFHNMLNGFSFQKIIINKKGKPIDYRFLEVNEAFEKLIGIKREKIINKKATKVFSGLENNVNEWIKRYGKVALRMEETKFELYSPMASKYFQVYAYSPVKGCVASIFDDITQRREIEKRKDEFISIASHELKTPLTSLRVYAQIIQKQVRRTGEKVLAEYLLRMTNQLNRLGKIVDNLLDVSKIRSGYFDFHEEAFNINDFVGEVVFDLQKTTEKRIEIEAALDEIIVADKDRLSQVLSNLISNAIKYSPNSDKIVVKVLMDDYNIVISIRDFGIGISRENQQKIFNKFFRVKGLEKEKLPGLGLGLYIASKIIEHYKGRIWVDSKEEKGSTFYFSLPRNLSKAN